MIIQKDFKNLPKGISKIPIAVSYDMGWSKRGTGKVYNSLSGHAYFIGCRTGKVFKCGVLQKSCVTCTSYQKRDLPIPNHLCNVNHNGSSGSMESLLCCQMIEELHDASGGKVVVSEVVSDDDSQLRSVCSA